MVFSGSSTNKTDRHNITEILLKEALTTVKQTKQTSMLGSVVWKSAGIQYPKSVPMIIVFKIQNDELELKIITWKPFCLNKRQRKLKRQSRMDNP